MMHAAPDRDPAVNRELDAAINALRKANTDHAKFVAFRTGAKKITIVGGDQSAIDHLSDVAIDIDALDTDLVQLALDQSSPARRPGARRAAEIGFILNKISPKHTTDRL
jgi:hypothetical protein